MPHVIRPGQPPIVRPSVSQPLPPPPPFPEGSKPAFRIFIPDNISKPTTEDVTLREGFDGLTPDEAVTRVLANAQMPIHKNAEKLTDETIRMSHKAFHMRINNLLVEKRYPRVWLEKLQADEIVLMGPLSQVDLPILKVTPKGGGAPVYYETNEGGVYQPSQAPKLSIVMEAKLTLKPDTVAIRYLPWRNNALSLEKRFFVIESP